jgi:gas vesicle protein
MKQSTKRLAIGTVLAAVAGYIAGILTAPKSGKETRGDIKKAALRAKAEAEKKLKALYSELDSLLAKAKRGTSKLSAGAKAEFADAVLKAQLAKDKAREVLNALHNGDADDKDLDAAVKEVKKSIDHLKKYLSKTKQA